METIMNNGKQPIFVRSIRQKDNYTFTIQWTDNKIVDYRLSELQKRCPCAKCVDENSGMRKNASVDNNVKAVKISNVGRYALRILYTSGCSTGIYDFDMLHKMGFE